MFKRIHVTIAVLTAGLTILGSEAAARTLCKYQLKTATGETGRANVKIRDDKRLEIRIRDAQPNTLYTVWVDFRKRLSGGRKILTRDYPLREGAVPDGVAPAFCIRCPVFEGIRLDPNSIMTDDDGDGRLRADLDYNLLKSGDSPVVGELSEQGENRVGGSWLRKYEEDPTRRASPQRVDDEGDPLVERATAQGITIVRHPDFVSHGHTPGVKNVDHRSAFSGNFPDDCLD